MAERTIEAPLLDINYGVGDRIQLKYEVPWLLFDEEGEEAKSGLGNSVVGIKWRFLDEDRHGIAMSIYPQLEFNNPTSSDERGLVDPGRQLLLPVEIARQVGPVEIFGEVGYTFVEEDRDEWLYGIAASWSLSARLELLGEIYGGVDQDFDDDELVCNLGGVYEIEKHHSLLFSLGRSFRDSRSGEPELLGYIAIQFTY